MITKCDIIIPVYNAPDELKECVDSLVKYTDLEQNRIIILNDCSPDPKISEYLETLSNVNGVSVVHNDENLGFVGTVNRGMRISISDVVLLNSDTIVTENWLIKIKDAAYSDQSIATVTPLTNNGTICSVPNFLEDNTLPEGFTIDSFANFIENISFREYPEVPTAVGFCMYIKRSAIDEIGLFDYETFGKGYAEENDFCCRVIEHGYKNIIADDTFIYHKGSMSFQGAKLDLLKKNLKTLNERYPYYEKNVHKFILSNPLSKIHENINNRLQSFKYSYQKKGNILFVLHNFFDEAYNHPVGGTEYHVKDIVMNLKGYNAFVMVSNSHEIVVKQYFDGELTCKYNFPLKTKLSLTHFRDRDYSNIVDNIIKSFNIGLIHIHHLIKHTFDIPFIAKKNNVKVLFTLHDYYLFCPKVNLLDENNEYCLEKRSESKCRNCLHSTYGFDTNFINKWKQQVKKMMENVDEFITPSKFTQILFENEFENVRGKISTIEHGVDINREFPKSKSFDQGKKLEVGFLGGIAPNKGSDLIYRLITSYPKDKVQWHIIGGLGDQKINLLEQQNLIKHGAYDRNNISGKLRDIRLDLICLLSPWPETFSYTLSEAWVNGIPVLVTPMGALQERVDIVKGGWVTESVKLEDIIEKLDEIYSMNNSEWNKIYNNINNYCHKNTKKMVSQYCEVYDKFISFNKYIENFAFNKIIFKAIKYYLPANDSGLSSEEHNNQILALQTELNGIRQTIGWKLLEKMRKENQTLLKWGKKVVYIALKFRNKRNK